MKLTLDNLDYTPSLDPENPLRVRRLLNQPARLEAVLVADSHAFVVPVTDARVVLERRDGLRLFTGYLESAPQYEYLGWGERGPVYRYRLAAVSDELQLDRRTLPTRIAFASRSAGSVLKQMAEDLLPGGFDLTAVEDVVTLESFFVSPQLSWSQHAAALGLLGRAAYRVHDGAVHFRGLGAVTHGVSESSSAFSPQSLRLRSPFRLANDVTVVGNLEPRAYVKDYFLGDGLTLGFFLSRQPFRRSTITLLEEEYKETALKPERWSVTDPSGAVSVSSGKLRVLGGTGSDGGTVVSLAEQMELAGASLLQHGEVTFSAASDGIIGGLYNGPVALSNCVAGFRVTPSGGQSVIQPVINGALAGSNLATQAGHRYLLTTRAYSREPFRLRQTYHSSLHPAGSGRGGGALPSSIRVVLEVHDVDPGTPGSQGNPSIVLYDQVLSGVPDFSTYAPVNAASVNYDAAFTRIARLGDVEVRSQVPSNPTRTRLLGLVSEGSECFVLDTPELRFHSQYVPVANETIVARYRSLGRALVRVTDPASIAAHSGPGDDGVRGTVRRVVSPPPRTAADCENAALALLDDLTQPAWEGDWEVWSDHLPVPGSDILPGDAISVDAPSRQASFTAIVRQVELELADLLDEHALYRVSFADDAAQTPAFEFDPVFLPEPLEDVLTTTTAGNAFIADLPDAEVTAITSTTVDVDAGADPPPGGGIEVRFSDFGWGMENDRNLAGRFTTRTFTLTRLTRIMTFYLRQFDSSSPPKYSRYSTSLHVDYPL